MYIFLVSSSFLYVSMCICVYSYRNRTTIMGVIIVIIIKIIFFPASSTSPIIKIIVRHTLLLVSCFAFVSLRTFSGPARWECGWGDIFEWVGLTVVYIRRWCCQIFVGTLVFDEGAHCAAVRGQIGFSSHQRLVLVPFPAYLWVSGALCKLKAIQC